MLKIPKEYIIEKIKEKSGLSTEEVNKKIKEKLEQLSGLISEDGAAHILANELGIKVMEASDNLQIKNVFAGMRNVEVLGKVIRVFEIRAFQSAQRSGKVGSFTIGDQTGIVRIVAWGSQADTLSILKEGDTVRIKSGYAKENQGRIEIHLNDNSKIIINPEGESVGEVKAARQRAERKKISELKNTDQNIELLGTIVQSFDPRFFEVCPYCQKRTRGVDGVFTCDAHGAIASPDYSYVMNVILDDGTETVRTIFFKNQMQHLLNLTHDEILGMRNSSFEDLKNDLLGKIIKVIGRVSSNEMFSRIEFVTQIVERDPNPEDELRKLEELDKSMPKPEAKPIVNEIPKQTVPQKPTPKTDDTKDAVPLDEIEDLSDDDIYE